MLESRPLGRIRFQLLGPAALFVDHSGGTVRVSAQKGLALLAYLAMNAGRPVGRAVLADLLWGDRVEAQARQSLRQAILTLRRDLGPTCSSLLSVDDQSLSLAVEADDVDALQFVTGAASPDPTVRQRCLDIPWAPFLDGFSIGVEPFDEWVVAERHRLEAVATRVFSDLAKQFDAAGDGERAILALERLIAIDPAEEERHRRLLTLEARYRGTDAALARAKQLVARLKRDVDAEPEPATLALVKEIRRIAGAQTKPGVLSKSPDAANPEPTHDSGAPTPTAAAANARTWHSAWPQRIRLAAAIAGVILAAGTVALLQFRAAQSPTAESITGQPTKLRIAVADPWQPPGQLPEIAHDKGRNLVPIAVLPFTTFGENAGSIQPIAETVTDDLTNVLSRVPGLRVISRQTMRTYQTRAIDVATIGTELGVRYVLEGSIRTLGDGQLRVNAELIDPKSRALVWSDRIERDARQQHEILDEIVGRLGRELQVSVTMIEAERASTDPSVAALVQKGWATHYSVGTRGSAVFEQARSYFTQALEKEPGNTSAKTGLAAVLLNMVIQDPSKDGQAHLDQAENLLREARASSPRSTGVHYYMGAVHRVRGRMQDAIESFERAIEINPSHASSYAHMGHVFSRIGQPAKGLEFIRYAMRLGPRDPILSTWLNFAGFAELELKQDESAIESFRRAQALRPRFYQTHVGLAAAYALSGRLEEARQAIAELQEFAPHMTRDRLIARFGTDRGGVRFRLTRGLDLALAPTQSSAEPSWQLPSRTVGDPIERERGLVAIAVLPFRSYAENGDSTDLVADMLTEDLTYLLSRVPVFRVISHQTAIGYRGQNIDSAAIGAELGVHYLVEGNVSMRGSILRVNVALVDARNRLQIWSGRFERVGEDRHAVQAEIVNGLARELRVSVHRIESDRTSANPDVHE